MGMYAPINGAFHLRSGEEFKHRDVSHPTPSQRVLRSGHRNFGLGQQNVCQAPLHGRRNVYLRLINMNNRYTTFLCPSQMVEGKTHEREDEDIKTCQTWPVIGRMIPL